MSSPAFVQSRSATTGAPGSLAFNSPNVAGNFLVVFVVTTSGIAGNITCIDTNNGNVYTPAFAQQDDGSLDRFRLFFLPNCKAGANTVQVAATGAPFFRWVIAEYSGVALTSPQDGTSAITLLQVSATPSSGNLATGSNNDLLIGFGSNGTAPGSVTAGTGFVMREQPSNAVFLEDNNSANNTAGNYSASVTYPSSIVSDIGIVAFKLAVSSISGSAGVAGATVSYSGPSSGSVTADGSGNFTIVGLANGSYTITPSAAGYTFSPPSQVVVVSGSNITGVNFTATSSGGGTSTWMNIWHDFANKRGLRG